jgi:hypothetical protein
MIRKSDVWRWLEQNAKQLQSLAAITTMVVAVTALIGVKVQIDASARQQREQSARDIYRDFLSLSIAQPKFASPDYCSILGSSDETGYNNYVQHLLYTSEQVLEALPDWDETLSQHWQEHKEVICPAGDWSNDTEKVQSLVVRFRAKHCTAFKSACT